MSIHMQNAVTQNIGELFFKGGNTVKKNLSIGGIILISCHLFTFCALVLASGEDIVKIQGVIMALDSYKKTMIVNEKSFVWSQDTAIYDSKGSPVTNVTFRPKTWVYIEGERDKDKRLTIINKIYLLPKYINKKERHLYPFME